MLCWLVLHSPDGEKFLVQSSSIHAIRPIHTHHDHVTHNANSLLYGIHQTGLGVRESLEEIQKMFTTCEGK
jgi:hypothetical protein